MAANDVLPILLWSCRFLLAQNYGIQRVILHQDNLSAIQLENNGKASSGKRTRHSDIRYYYIADQVRLKTMEVAHEPTEMMVADFFTKPLQGAAFLKFRRLIMNE